MSKFLFFLKAYPFRKRISLLALLFLEICRIDRTRWERFFDSSLIESRAILGFIYNSGGVVNGYSTHLRVIIPYKGTRLILNLRWNTSDFVVFEQVIIKEEYAPLIDKNLISPVIVDAGANIGCTTIYLKTHYPNSRILSIEPDTSNFKALEENVRRCGFDGIVCLQAALWHENGIVHLGRNFRDSRDWSVQVQPNGDAPVSAGTMGSMLKQMSVEQADILKMDIEGAELDVFLRDLSLADVLRRLTLIAIEVHDDKERQIERVLTQTGFLIFKQGETLFGKKSVAFNQINN